MRLTSRFGVVGFGGSRKWNVRTPDNFGMEFVVAEGLLVGLARGGLHEWSFGAIEAGMTSPIAVLGNVMLVAAAPAQLAFGYFVVPSYCKFVPY